MRGVWDGFALKPSPTQPVAAAVTDIDLPAGNYRVSTRIECGNDCPDGAELAISAGGVELRRTPWPSAGSVVALVVPVTHAGGKLHLEFLADAKNLHPGVTLTALWFSAFEVERERR